MIASRSVSCSARTTLQRFADRQVDVVGRSSAPSPSPTRLCAFRRRPRHAGHGRSERYGSSSACSAQLPSSYRRRRFGRIPSNLPVPALGRIQRRTSGDRTDNLALLPRQLAERRRRDRSRNRGSTPAAPRAPACGRRAPRARWRPRRATSIRRARRARDRSRPSRRVPGTRAQAPCGELNENARGVISGMLSPQSTQASRRENNRSPLSYELMTTMSSARLSATSIDSVSRRSMPPRTISRSTTTSIV